MDMARDLTKAQFTKKLEANGIRLDAFGFYSVCKNALVYSKNGGNTRREQLAYLLAEQRRIIKRVNTPGEGGKDEATIYMSGLED